MKKLTFLKLSGSVPATNEVISVLGFPPSRLDAGTSMMRPITYPFTSPKGSSEPPMMSTGSVVGLPSLSMIQPSGIDLPSFSARFTFPLATMLVARSGMSPPGTATDSGLVPKRDSMPREGARIA